LGWQEVAREGVAALWKSLLEDCRRWWLNDNWRLHKAMDIGRLTEDGDSPVNDDGGLLKRGRRP
jgi:hypothetical protein